MALRINKVLISDEISEKCPAILRAKGVEVVHKTKMSKAELIAELAKGYDALLVRSATKVDAEVLSSSTSSLKVVGRAGTGVDNIDIQAASKHGVVVINTPTGNSISAAELTCYMIMALARRGPQAYASMVAGKWERKAFMGSELEGKTLAVVGLGRIGREVAHRMQAFGMTTIGFDPFVTKEAAAEFGVELLAIDDIFPRADYITFHVPLIPQTKDLINTASLAKCKPTVRIINCARGGIVNEADVLTALEANKCGGLALDVFEQEPPTNRALIAHPLVVSTPHLGASTEEAQTRVAEEVAESLLLMSAGTALRGAINGGSMAAMLTESTARWVRAARALGEAISTQGGGKVATLQYPAEHESLARALTTGVLVGLMRDDPSVNMINADTIAADKGFKVTATSVADTVLTVLAGSVRVEGLPTANGVRLLDRPTTNGTAVTNGQAKKIAVGGY